MYELKPVRVKCLIDFAISDGDLKNEVLTGAIQKGKVDDSAICLYIESGFIYQLQLVSGQYEIIGDDKTEVNAIDCLVPYTEPTVGLEFIPNQQAIKQLEIKVAYH